MKITKRQLRQLVEQNAYATVDSWSEYMNQVENLHDSLQDLAEGIPFRSAGVRMAIEKISAGYEELKDAILAEDEVRAWTDD